MEEVSKEVRLELANRKLAIWENTLYDAGLDNRIAQATKNMSKDKESQERMKEALIAVDVLKNEIKELENEQGTSEIPD